MFKNYFGLNKKYNVILADPPWSFVTFSEKGKDRSAEQHYDCMTLNDIKMLPIKTIINDKCVLFLWTTDTHLHYALDVIDSWGFEYKTIGFHWSKVCKKSDKLFTGLGYYTRANNETCLLAVPKGGKCPSRKNKGVHRTILNTMDENELSNYIGQLQDEISYLKNGVPESVTILSRLREHSRKPDEQYDRIEELFDGPYCELFARHKRDNWDGWGSEYNV